MMKSAADLRKDRCGGWPSSDLRGQLADFLRTDRWISLLLLTLVGVTTTASENLFQLAQAVGRGCRR